MLHSAATRVRVRVRVRVRLRVLALAMTFALGCRGAHDDTAQARVPPCPRAPVPAQNHARRPHPAQQRASARRLAAATMRTPQTKLSVP